MKKYRVLMMTLLFIGVLLSGCGLGEEEGNENIHVVTSFSVLHDIVVNVGQGRIEADFLTPVGEDPHEFEPTPSTFQLIADADLLMFNGFNLDYWIQGLAQNADSQAQEVILTDSVMPIPLSEEAGDLAGKEDPHSWLDPKNVIIYVKNVEEALVEADPDNAAFYHTNAEAYIAELEELDQWIEEQVSQIPAEQRFVVTSESAFKYFAQGYGFEYDSIWEINAHEEGSPRQISRLIEVLKEQGVPAVFVETSVDARPMERVAEEAGIEIAGKVYTDSLGAEGTEAETYIDMMKRNVETFVSGLISN